MSSEPEATSGVGERVLVMAASTSSTSLNRALARAIGEALDEQGENAGLVDLAEYPMPLYQADLEAAEGVPPEAHRLADRVRAAEVLVIVSPEYNRAFPPLLKNTIDWLSRIDRAILTPLTVLLASATPGPGGGANVLAMIRQWLTSIHVTVADGVLSIGAAKVDDDGKLEALDAAELRRFAGEVTTAKPPSI